LIKLVLHDLLHSLAVASGRRGGSRSSVAGVLVANEVIGHLKVEFLGSLLSWTSAAGTSLLSLAGLGLAGSALLVGRGRLGLGFGLSLGLSSALSQSLGSRENLVCLRGTNDNLDLDGPSVNEQAVQFLESIAGAVDIAEGYVGDTATLRVWPVDQFNPLDGSNGLNKVLLLGRMVSDGQFVALIIVRPVVIVVPCSFSRFPAFAETRSHDQDVT